MGCCEPPVLIRGQSSFWTFSCGTRAIVHWSFRTSTAPVLRDSTPVRLKATRLRWPGRCRGGTKVAVPRLFSAPRRTSKRLDDSCCPGTLAPAVSQGARTGPRTAKRLRWISTYQRRGPRRWRRRALIASQGLTGPAAASAHRAEARAVLLALHGKRERSLRRRTRRRRNRKQSSRPSLVDRANNRDSHPKSAPTPASRLRLARPCLGASRHAAPRHNLYLNPYPRQQGDSNGHYRNHTHRICSRRWQDVDAGQIRSASSLPSSRNRRLRAGHLWRQASPFGRRGIRFYRSLFGATYSRI